MKEKCMERSQVPRARAAVCEQEEMFLIPVRVYIYTYDRERDGDLWCDSCELKSLRAFGGFLFVCFSYRCLVIVAVATETSLTAAPSSIVSDSE